MVTCNPGDTEISGPDACPPGASCYSNTICCSTVWCARAEAGDGGSCDPSAEYNRSYVGSSPAECALIDFMCPPNTTYFGNACGCGCEQASTCPEWVDCMPGPGTLNPLCTTEGHAMCPYTKLAF